MAVEDAVELLVLLHRNDAEEIERDAGAEGITLVQHMQGVVAVHLTRSDMYTSLWHDFQRAPEDQSAELTGALEALVEADGELAVELEGLLEAYNGLVLQSQRGWQPPEEEAGQQLVGGLRDDMPVMEGEHRVARRIGDVMEGLPESEPDDPLTLEEEVTGRPADYQGAELDEIDVYKEASALGDDSRATMPAGPLGEVSVSEGEEIGGDTYLHERFLPDEDIEDEYRPGTLYDDNPEGDVDYEQSLRPSVVTAGDIQDTLAPAEAALNEHPALDAQERSRVRQSLRAVQEELGKGNMADAARLRAQLEEIESAAPDVWEVLAWELIDLSPDLPPAVRQVISELRPD